MIVHESRNSAFRRPFGAAETGTEVYLAAEKAGAADMTLRIRSSPWHPRAAGGFPSR